MLKATAAVAAATIIALAGTWLGTFRVHADDSDSDQNLAAIGLRIAPKFLNMTGKDPTLVGLGSYIVNAMADCNGCHGSDPANEFLPTNNPYRKPNNAPIVFNQATYLNGGAISDRWGRESSKTRKARCTRVRVLVQTSSRAT